MGVHLLGIAMLGQTVVAAIIYGFVGTDWTTLPVGRRHLCVPLDNHLLQKDGRRGWYKKKTPKMLQEQEILTATGLRMCV